MYYHKIDLIEDTKIGDTIFKKGSSLYVEFNREKLTELSISKMQKSWFSSRNKKFYSIRQKDGNTKVSLELITYDYKNGELWLTYFVVPTYLNKENPHHSPVTNPKTGIQNPVLTIDKKLLYRYASKLGQGSKVRNRIYRYGTYYIIQIQFLDLGKIIKTQGDDSWFALKPGQKISLIQKILQTWDNVRLFSSDPGYYWQGIWYRLAKMKSAIYEFPRGAIDKNIWQKRHGNKPVYLTKHFIPVFETLYFNKDAIVKAIDKEFGSDIEDI
jgi:hypothetical protein